MKKRVLSALLVLCLAFSLMGTAWAADSEQATPETAQADVLSEEADAAEPTPDPTAEPAATATPDPAATPAPTETPAATATPEPSDEPEATPAATAAPEAAEQAEAETAALPEAAAIPEGYTVQRTVRDEENGFAVTVYAPEGVIPADAVLCATLLDKVEHAEEYEKAEQELEESGLPVAAAEDTADAAALALTAETENTESEEAEDAAPSYGFAALDIHLENAEGKEIKLEGDVYVSIDATALLPEDADPATVTVQHHEEQSNGEVTVEKVADAADETAGVVEVTAAETPAADTAETATADVQAAFEVGSFSTFTITWNNNSYRRITVHCVDVDGNEIGSNLGDITRNQTITMRDIAPEIPGYTYDHAKVAWSADWDGTTFTQLRYEDWEWKYRNGNNGRWNEVGYYQNVYLVYRKDPVELKTVETVDSTAEGVHMYICDFDGKAFNGGEYGSGDVKEGLATKTVNNNGWPTLTGASNTQNGRSFAQVFFGSNNLNAYNLGDQYAVNHLFLQSKYDEDGTFYYSAFENFATLENDSDKNFTVYEQLGSPNGENNYFYQRGNFMPYNTLNTSVVRNHNRYDDEGNPLDENDPRYNEDIYGFNEGNNFHFGMYVWADFYQPQGGIVESNDGETSEEMVFEFTGDDDMWVYIDGVLVLDLGGIHDAQSGRINFATGKIDYTDTMTGEEPDWHSTTLKAQYGAANRVGSVDWDGDTFADGTSHRIQIFYMERGEGASNLKMQFNLKTIPDGQLSVRKEVENYYAPQVADVKYTMEVTVNGKAYANQPYTILGKEDEEHKTDEKGRFTLHHDETALFPDLKVEDNVTVQEVGTSDTEEGVQISKNYEISYTVTDGAGQTMEGAGTEGKITATMPGYGSIKAVVNNKATYTRPLKLVKNFDGTEGDSAPTNFEATYTLYEVNDRGEKVEPAIGSVKYSDFENGEYVFWLDTDKKYTIEESFDNGDNDGGTDELPWQSVTTTTNDPADGTEDSEGIVELDENDATLENATDDNPVDTITLTNHYGEVVGDLTITKAVSGVPTGSAEVSEEVKSENFIFTITAGEGVDTDKLKDGVKFKVMVDTTEKGEISFTQEGENPYTATVTVIGTGSVTIVDLPIGEYTVTENDPGDLTDYYYTGNKYTVGNDETNTVTVDPETPGAITVTNNYKPFRTVIVTKTVGGEMGDTTAPFNFTTTVTRDELTAKIGGESDQAESDFTFGTAQDAETINAELKENDSDDNTAAFTSDGYTLANAETITITKLKEGDTITITETDYGKNGYDTSYAVNGTTQTGTATSVTIGDNDFKDQEGNTVRVTVTNDRPVVPPTGLESNHTKPYALMVGAGALAGLALVGGILARRARRRREW